MLRHPNLTSLQKKKLRSAVFIGLFLLATILIFLFAGRPLVAFVSRPDEFRQWILNAGVWGYFAFVGMMLLQIVVAIIPGEPLQIAAGYAFGSVTGAILCIVGAALGSLMVFLFVRFFGAKAVEVFFPREKINSMRFLQNEKKLGFFLFLFFLIPGTPKDIMTYCVGLTKIRLHNWMLISTLARTPAIITSTIGGEALGLQNYQFAVIVFVGTLLISGIGLLFFRQYSKREESAPLPPTSEQATENEQSSTP